MPHTSIAIGSLYKAVAATNKIVLEAGSNGTVAESPVSLDSTAIA